jgi:hypothetical protein
MDKDVQQQIDELWLEVVAQRLITRGIITHMVTYSDRPIKEVFGAFQEACRRLPPEAASIPDLDPDLHRKAAELALARANDLMAEFGRLMMESKEREPPTAPALDPGTVPPDIDKIPEWSVVASRRD